MFQKNPDLTLGQVRDLLKQHVTRRNLRGGAEGWGGGKLDRASIGRILESVRR